MIDKRPKSLFTGNQTWWNGGWVSPFYLVVMTFKFQEEKIIDRIDILMWKKVHFDFVHPKSHFHLQCRFYFVWLARCRSLNWTCAWLSKMKRWTLETHKFWNIAGLWMSQDSNNIFQSCRTFLEKLFGLHTFHFLNCSVIVGIYSSSWKIQAHILTSLQPDVMNVLHLTSIFSKLINEPNRINCFFRRNVSLKPEIFH